MGMESHHIFGILRIKFPEDEAFGFEDGFGFQKLQIEFCSKVSVYGKRVRKPGKQNKTSPMRSMALVFPWQ